uniref:Uncharacterized protein n=1 Tax=Arundo donax TaxID=35708 RepID=A0A0A9DYW2_ARUDO
MSSTPPIPGQTKVLFNFPVASSMISHIFAVLSAETVRTCLLSGLQLTAYMLPV